MSYLGRVSKIDTLTTTDLPNKESLLERLNEVPFYSQEIDSYVANDPEIIMADVEGICNIIFNTFANPTWLDLFNIPREEISYNLLNLLGVAESELGSSELSSLIHETDTIYLARMETLSIARENLIGSLSSKLVCDDAFNDAAFSNLENNVSLDIQSYADTVETFDSAMAGEYLVAIKPFHLDEIVDLTMVMCNSIQASVELSAKLSAVLPNLDTDGIFDSMNNKLVVGNTDTLKRAIDGIKLSPDTLSLKSTILRYRTFIDLLLRHVY